MRYRCCVCGSLLSRWNERGVDSPAIRDLDIFPAGRRLTTCPVCQSYDRERLLVLFLKSRPSLLAPGARILHIAPERHVSQLLKSIVGANYVSGDLDPTLADCKVDVTEIQFPDSHFDAVICNHVLEHVPDDRKAMLELKRVLKPGGWTVLQVPIGKKLTETLEDQSVQSDEERLARFGQIDHVRVYAEPDYVRRLSSVGFEVELIDLRKELGELEYVKHGLHPDEKLFFCGKPSE